MKKILLFVFALCMSSGVVFGMDKEEKPPKEEKQLAVVTSKNKSLQYVSAPLPLNTLRNLSSTYEEEHPIAHSIPADVAGMRLGQYVIPEQHNRNIVPEFGKIHVTQTANKESSSNTPGTINATFESYCQLDPFMQTLYPGAPDYFATELIIPDLSTQQTQLSTESQTALMAALLQKPNAISTVALSNDQANELLAQEQNRTRIIAGLLANADYRQFLYTQMDRQWQTEYLSNRVIGKDGVESLLKKEENKQWTREALKNDQDSQDYFEKEGNRNRNFFSRFFRNYTKTSFGLCSLFSAVGAVAAVQYGSLLFGKFLNALSKTKTA